MKETITVTLEAEEGCKRPDQWIVFDDGKGKCVKLVGCGKGTLVNEAVKVLIPHLDARCTTRLFDIWKTPDGGGLPIPAASDYSGSTTFESLGIKNKERVFLSEKVTAMLIRVDRSVWDSYGNTCMTPLHAKVGPFEGTHWPGKVLATGDNINIDRLEIFDWLGMRPELIDVEQTQEEFTNEEKTSNQQVGEDTPRRRNQRSTVVSDDSKLEHKQGKVEVVTVTSSPETGGGKDQKPKKPLLNSDKKQPARSNTPKARNFEQERQRQQEVNSTEAKGNEDDITEDDENPKKRKATVADTSQKKMKPSTEKSKPNMAEESFGAAKGEETFCARGSEESSEESSEADDEHSEGEESEDDSSSEEEISVSEIDNSASEKTKKGRLKLKISTAPEETKEAEKPRTPVGQHKPPKNIGGLAGIPTAFECQDKAGRPLSKEEIAEFDGNQEFFQRRLQREIKKQEILAPTIKKLEKDFEASYKKEQKERKQKRMAKVKAEAAVTAAAAAAATALGMIDNKAELPGEAAARASPVATRSQQKAKDSEAKCEALITYPQGGNRRFKCEFTESKLQTELTNAIFDKCLEEELKMDKETIANGRERQCGDIRLKFDGRTHKANVKLSSFFSAGRPTKVLHAEIIFVGLRGGARSKNQTQSARQVSPEERKKQPQAAAAAAAAPEAPRKSTRHRYQTTEADLGLDTRRAGGKRKGAPKRIDAAMARKKAKKERNFINDAKRLQKLTGTVGPKAPWKRAVREIADEVHKFMEREDEPKLKWNVVAFQATQEAGEQFVTELMADADVIAMCANRRTVMSKDFRAAQAIGRHQGLTCRQEKPLLELKKEAAAKVDQALPEDDGDGFSSREDSEKEEQEGKSKEKNRGKKRRWEKTNRRKTRSLIEKTNRRKTMDFSHECNCTHTYSTVFCATPHFFWVAN